jgi:hypothetical protein
MSLIADSEIMWGVRGRVVKFVDFKPLALTAVGSNPYRDLDSFMWGTYPASLRKVGGPTELPIRAWNNAQRGTCGVPSWVKLERRGMTYTVSMWRETQSNIYRNHVVLFYGHLQRNWLFLLYYPEKHITVGGLTAEIWTANQFKLL